MKREEITNNFLSAIISRSAVIFRIGHLREIECWFEMIEPGIIRRERGGQNARTLVLSDDRI